MAEEGLAFRWLAAHASALPYAVSAIVLQAVWSCALVATGTYRALFTRVIYTEWLFFALMAVGLMRLRETRKICAALSRVGYTRWCRWCSALRPLVVAAIQIAADPLAGRRRASRSSC